MMQWICLAVRPLSVRELRFAMASDCIESHESMHSCQDANISTEEDERMERLITSLSGGLAEVKYHESEDPKSQDYRSVDDGDSTTVQLIHQSIYDFLLPHGLRNLAVVSSWEFSAQNLRLSESFLDKNILGHCHQRLLRSCINYLKLKEIIQIAQDEFQVANEKPNSSEGEKIRYELVFLSWIILQGPGLYMLKRLRVLAYYRATF